MPGLVPARCKSGLRPLPPGPRRSARRSASSNGIGSHVEQRGPRRVGHDRRRRQSLDQRPRDARVDRRDETDPQRREPRREERDGQLRAPVPAEHVGHAVEHVAVGEDVGPADLDLPPGGIRDARGLLHIGEHVVDRDRLGLRRQPRRRDHRGQALDEVAQRPVGLAPGADHHRGAQVGQRRPLGAQRLARSRGGCAGARSAGCRRARRGRRPGRCPRASPSGRRPWRPRGPSSGSRRCARGPSSAPGSRRRPCRCRRPAGSRAAARCPRAISHPSSSRSPARPAVAHHAAHVVTARRPGARPSVGRRTRSPP